MLTGTEVRRKMLGHVERRRSGRDHSGAVKRELDGQSGYKLLPLTSHLDLDQEEAEGGWEFTCRGQVATNICGKRMIFQTMRPEGGFWKQSTKDIHRKTVEG